MNAFVKNGIGTKIRRTLVCKLTQTGRKCLLKNRQFNENSTLHVIGGADGNLFRKLQRRIWFLQPFSWEEMGRGKRRVERKGEERGKLSRMRYYTFGEHIIVLEINYFLITCENSLPLLFPCLKCLSLLGSCLIIQE